ncbi:transposable element Tcb1 transposase [Trichonephila clavipes]|nr:transposable element Tcb1 transposase [Trichonephila clavipes]
MVWGDIAYNTWSALVLIRCIMTSCNHMGFTHTTAQRNHFSARQCSALHDKGVTRLSPHCFYHSLACPISRFVSNRAYLGSFGMVSWSFYEFERTRGTVTSNIERNVSRYHT